VGDRDAYVVLGLEPGASSEEITKAWREMVKVFHPDAHPNASEAERRQWQESIQRINAAYDELTSRTATAEPTNNPPRRPRRHPGRPPGRAHARERAEHADQFRAPRPGECIFCGYTPARLVHFRELSGRLVYHTRLSCEEDFCRSCGLAMGRQMQNRTLWQGWWGFFSIALNPLAVIANAYYLWRISRLGEPTSQDPRVAGLVASPLAPGKRVLARSGVWFVVAVIAGFVALWFAIPTTPEGASATQAVNRTAPETRTEQRATWSIGACVTGSSRVRPIRCWEPGVTGRIIESVTSPSQCPLRADAYVIDGAKVWCIVEHP
jgi:hypothetical protein